MPRSLYPDEQAICKAGLLLADPARVAILVALCHDVALSASELTERAKVSASTTSAHLAKLLEIGWISVEQHGRQRYYRLASVQVERLLKQVTAIIAPEKASVIDPRASQSVLASHLARTCYDHLAGKLGVALTEALIARGALEADERDFLLTEVGKTFLAEKGIDVAPIVKQRRAFARRCLDWSEHRDHLGGAFGAAIFHHWLAQGWVQRQEDSRVLQLTPTGLAQLPAWGVMDLPQID